MRSPEYTSWRAMLGRCRNPKIVAYPACGGRGIGVCERWLAYEHFLADMGRRPSPKHTLDRKDNDGPYSPDNCRWATRREQVRNRRNTVWVEIGGERITLAEASTRFGVRYMLAYQRIVQYGWSPERALRGAA